MFSTLKQIVFWSIIGIIGSIIVIILWRRRFANLELLTYKDAIKYFVENKPANVHKGILIRKAELGGTYLMSQLFLDKNDEVMMKPNGGSYGRRVRVQQIDAELRDAFGDKDVIVFT